VAAVCPWGRASRGGNRYRPWPCAFAHRERQDRSIVNTPIGIVNTQRRAGGEAHRSEATLVCVSCSDRAVPPPSPRLADASDPGVHDARSGCSRCRISVFTMPIRVFTMLRSGCSRCADPVFTIGRNPQPGPPRPGLLFGSMWAGSRLSSSGTPGDRSSLVTVGAVCAASHAGASWRGRSMRC
jgi:hypothetical protein